ncbi:hypothetical protein LARV_01696 [Longilinea arvoryzae]|uniref:Glycosyltransferase RgtA/B/C/D-like domain-containing protein n=1 Tax=Longilinea arvoryzae TaxID=360412 RepID=A0A0S7BJ96_9CHLR|nr:hypothetical protein [Longilinea arvoryzae]GAP13937.1 hypothetical protein LARV_01696 [Longilinea arvoryzae]
MRDKLALIFSAIFGLLIGGILAFAAPAGSFFMSWLAYGLLSALTCAVLALAWRDLGGGRSLAWMILLAFGLRIAAGAALQAALPQYGNASEPERNGYLFYDAYARDQAAWDLARSDQPLAAAFSGDYTDQDQYGGLLAISAAVYRLLSPDARRPLLTVLLGAFGYTLGLPFLATAIRKRWWNFAALVAGWIYALYPQSILLGASQMREPFLMGAIALATWAVVVFTEKKWVSIGALAGCLAWMGLVNSRIAIAAGGVLLVWLALEQLKNLPVRLRRWSWLILLLAGAVVAVGSWEWLSGSGTWDIQLLQVGSGMVDKRLGELPMALRLPFVIAYGVAQPVLPAAVADVTVPLRQAISILWAVGWYALAPLLVFGLFIVWRAQPETDQRVLVWLALSAMLWTFISAARGGGDQWDNPRYRTLFLPWMALLAGWAWQWARERHNPWLWRTYAVALIFMAAFMLWYLGRYAHWFGGLYFWYVVAGVVLLSAAILVGGWWRDRSLTRHREKL